MALAFSVVRRSVFGDQRVVVADITFDNSYPTGGEAFAPSDVGLASSNFDMVLHNSTLGGYVVDYDYTNKKFLVRSSHGGHNHTLHFQTSAAANAVSAAADQLRTAAAAFDVSGVANTAGEGGIVTNSAPAANSETALSQLAATSNVLNNLVLRVICYARI